MTAPVRHGREEDRTADHDAGGGAAREQLCGDVSLIMQHDDECIGVGVVEHGIGAEWARDPDALRCCRFDRRLDDVDLFPPEKTALARMRIETADVDFGVSDSKPPQRRVGNSDDVADPLALFAARLLDRGEATADDLAAIRVAAEAEVAEAMARAQESPDVTATDLAVGEVYA